MNRYSRKDSSGGDSTIEMMANVQHNHDQYRDQYHDQYHHNGAQQEEDTHKEVYASPYNHYLGSPNNEPRPSVPENYPELAPHSGLEAVKSDDPNKYGGAGGVFVQKYHDDSPIPVTATPASDKLLPPAPPSDKKPWYQNWTIRILIIALTVIIVVAIIVGAVVGTQAGKNDSSNDSPSETETATGTRTTTTSTPTSTSSPDELKMGVTYNATFTMYGTNDGSGGTNCNVKQTSCAFYSDVSNPDLGRNRTVSYTDLSPAWLRRRCLNQPLQRLGRQRSAPGLRHLLAPRDL